MTDILLINPNTTASITELVLKTARRFASKGTSLRAVTGAFGPRYIASRVGYAIAGHAAVDAFANDRGRKDAVVLACFGDPGLAALKEIAKVPVVGMADASILQACAMGNRFSIVTGGERWKSMLEEFVASHGLASRLASVRTVAPTGADIARNPKAAMALLAKGCQRLRARRRRRRGDPGRGGPGRACGQAEDHGRCASARWGRLRHLDGRGTGRQKPVKAGSRSARLARAGREHRPFACPREAAEPLASPSYGEVPRLYGAEGEGPKDNRRKFQIWNLRERFDCGFPPPALRATSPVIRGRKGG